ncbi:MAG TPA: arginine deiminase-related protein [Flavobacteriaceae bacterium]|nr:arginine deiminase-related protein [Flavobacteriaceae bacterium]
MQQITDTILMVRPAAFRMNEQTKVNNFFQEELDLDLQEAQINERAQEEFDAFVEKLRSVGVNVIVHQDKKENDTPDSIYPNNWISFHQSGNIAVYPMFAENRRRERNEEVLKLIESDGYRIDDVVDYTSAEEDDLFLEGTGSLILDRVNRKAYCALSDRADEDLVIEFCEDFEYTPVIFTAYHTVDGKREIVYHTNILMCVGTTFVVICLDTIDDKKEKKNIVQHFKQDNKEVIAITEEQMNQFAGNMLQVVGADGKTYLAMSEAARNSLTEAQVKTIEKHTNILSSDLHIIETLGGGSARCMMAEVFLPKK